MSLLEVRGVSKQFGGVRALDDVSFSVESGAIVGVMGANGAGKTTLFAVIAGHEQPSAGSVLLNDRSLVGLSPDAVCRRGVARTFQIVRPFAGLSALENATIAARFGVGQTPARRDAEHAAQRALATVGLADRAGQLAGSLTLSDQKRLEIARAIATGGQLLMLDEVMAGLTPVEVQEMIAIIRSARTERGLTVLVIEHVLRALMELAERIVVLHLGRKIAEGSPAEIGANAQVAQVYFGEDPEGARVAA